MKYNRMRRLPYIREQEFGKNTLELYRKLERTGLKISDYKNHRRFLLRCLSKDRTPVSLKLKNNIGTYKSKCIIHNTERKLLNERIRNINNTIENLEHVKYMYENELNGTVSKGIYKECEDYIEYAKETRHNKVLQRQVSKFERLIQKISAEKSGHSKQCHSSMYMYSGNSSRYMHQQQDTDTDTDQDRDTNQVHDSDPDQDQKKKWVINLSDVPLTPTQEAVLAHWPNFAVTPKYPPIVEYITSLEVACQKLNTNTAEELRSEVYRTLRHSNPPSQI